MGGLVRTQYVHMLHTYIHTYVYIHTYIHTYIYAYAYTYTYIYIHTYIHTYIHIGGHFQHRRAGQFIWIYAPAGRGQSRIRERGSLSNVFT
jgi:hypothetical protein